MGSKELQHQKKRTSTFIMPLEDHWCLPPQAEKRSSMSFKSVQGIIARTRRSSTLRNIIQGVRDPREEHMVQSLKELLLSTSQLPEKHDDYHTLLRFLRMRDFNVLRAKDMFLNMIKWREDSGIDNIAKDFKFDEYEEVKRCYSHGYHGVDRCGRPLYLERIGLIDLNKLFKATTVDRFVKYHISEQEKTLNLRYPACSVAAKRHIASTTTILDVKGVGINSFSKPARELFVEIQKIDSNYYPETLNKLYIINAGSGFRALWKVLTAFLDARTLSKIQVLGSNYHSALSEAVDPSNLPNFLGGSCTCSEYGGCLLKDIGPWTNPEFSGLLQEVFGQGKKFTDDETDITMVTEESSDIQIPSLESFFRQIGSNSERALDMRLDDTEVPDIDAYGSNHNIRRNHVKEPISQKILQLEGWLAASNEILGALIKKQQELAGYINQLKKLTSG
ncbi:phosphatidylinositol/phosphatidylcholine transfer protein SFH11 isoform X1 [Typha latifolia]|uniref:phosphatidylinositol/phosphatidylcholine transfer protein SFH11 isoform X1 n=1 Tax=Typha latifolia TaxID=4733 RepID=UPI003C2F4343